jgi:hypothetical protein
MHFIVFPCAVSFIEKRDVVVVTEQGIRAKTFEASASCRLAIAVPAVLNKNSGCIILRRLLSSSH